VAGGVFAWLRLRSRSLLAPVLAHAAVNVSAYLAGRRTASRQAGLTAGPGAAGPRARPARERS
jgi:membrane protease YdiL (CAAX protease family)